MIVTLSMRIETVGYYNSAVRLLEDKVRVAEAYARLLLKADPTASVASHCQRDGKILRRFALKVGAEIKDSHLMDPKQKVRWHGSQRGAGAKTISDEDGEILQTMQRENSLLTLGSYHQAV